MTQTIDPSLLLSFRNSLRACTACELSAQCNGPVPWFGDVNSIYAIMGEAPGSTEDQQGRPFVGSSGNILSHWLKVAGFKPNEITFMNAVSCLPHGTPTAEHIAACRPWMNGQLEFIKPKILITLGKVAFSSIRNGQRWPELSAIHGKPYRHPVYDMWIWSSYHPAAYLRGHNKRYEEKITTDLAKLKAWDGGLLDECYVCGDEFYNWDEWMIGYCRRHSSRQGLLFPEDM